MLVYIAGPYTPNNGMAISDNIDNARILAEECWRNDIPAICPQLNTSYMDAVAPPEVFYQGDLDILERCDAVLMVDGWELSFGSRMERIFAFRNNIPVFESVKGLIAYRDSMAGEPDD